MPQPRPVPAIRPPALLMNRWTGLVLLVVLLVPFFVPIPMELRRHPIISPLGDQLHVVLLAALTLLLYWRGPLSGRLAAAAGVAAFCGGAIEFIQIPFGRSANLGDFGLDLVGIGLVVGFVGWRGLGRKAGLWLCLALLLVIPYRLHHIPFVAQAAYRNRTIFPLIADLEGSRDDWIWNGNEAVAEIVPRDDTPAGPGHVVRLDGGPPANWPSAEMRRFPHDWSGYHELRLDVRLVEGPDPTQKFGVRLDDFVGRRETTWISNGFTADGSWQTFRIPLTDRTVTDGTRPQERVFDLGDVDRILIFLPRPAGRAVLEIDNLRLQ